MNVHGIIQVMRPLHEVVTALAIRHLHNTHADAKEIAKHTRALRDQVFQFRQMAKVLVETSERNLRMSAGVLLLIEKRMQYMGETYELFDDIPDKQFVLEAAEFINQHTTTMLKALAAYDLGEVLEMVHAYEQLDDTKYVAEHAHTLVAYDALVPQIHDAETRRFIQVLIAGATVAMMGMVLMINPWLGVLPLVLGVGLGGWYLQQQQARSARLQVLARSCDIHRVRAVLQRYQSAELAKREYEQLHRVVKAFFGDISPSQHLTGVFAVIQMEMGITNTTVNVSA